MHEDEKAALEGRIEEMEGKLRSGIEDVRADVAGKVEALREEQAKAMRHVERRLVRLEAGRSAQDGYTLERRRDPHL